MTTMRTSTHQCRWRRRRRDVGRAQSPHSFGELAFLDETPACALRSATVVALTGDAEDVADHHIVMRRNELPQLAQEVVLLDAAWPHERADTYDVHVAMMSPIV